MASGWEKGASRLAYAFTEQIIDAVLAASLDQVVEMVNEEDAATTGGSRLQSDSNASDARASGSSNSWVAHRIVLEASLARHAGSVSAVAHELGARPRRVRRWMVRFGLK